MKTFKVTLERSNASTNWNPKIEVHYIQAEELSDIYSLLSADDEVIVSSIIELTLI